jgi:hypoxanthine-DNA glycosylase
MESKSFAPIIDKSSNILILGTMPGIKSLEKQEYYAHDRNAFWPILFKLFDATYSTDYQLRINILFQNRIALWDTLKFCYREGSLDSDIQHAEPNDISRLLINHPKIKSIVFNGNYAEKFYKKYNKKLPGINYLSMPSTSPANARLTFEQKLNKWSELKDLL